MYIKDLEKQHMNAFKTLLITNNNKYDSIIVCNILFLNKLYPIWGPQKEVFKSDKTPAVTEWGTHSADIIAH